tara:strand:- start:3207 stop:3959 length:753 start_codon:yes stop_codon:yes gene_type:complete
MASIGQLLMAGQGANSRRAIQDAQSSERRRREKASRGGGLGRALGFGGSFLATMGMANPILAAGLTGLGALAGRSAGRAVSGGLERDANKNINTDFYQGAQKEYRDEIGDYQQGMRERMLMDTGKDAFTAYNLGKLNRSKQSQFADKVTKQGNLDNPFLNETDEQFWAAVDASQDPTQNLAKGAISNDTVSTGSGLLDMTQNRNSNLNMTQISNSQLGSNNNFIPNENLFENMNTTSYANRYGNTNGYPY